MMMSTTLRDNNTKLNSVYRVNKSGPKTEL
jgi:hypothetical protein